MRRRQIRRSNSRRTSFCAQHQTYFFVHHDVYDESVSTLKTLTRGRSDVTPVGSVKKVYRIKAPQNDNERLQGKDRVKAARVRMRRSSSFCSELSFFTVCNSLIPVYFLRKTKVGLHSFRREGILYWYNRGVPLSLIRQWTLHTSNAALLNYLDTKTITVLPGR
jgi:hypothetical protein